jgi:hypothetical protein
MPKFQLKVFFGGNVIAGVNGPDYSGHSLKAQFNIPPSFVFLKDWVGRRITSYDYVFVDMQCRVSIGDHEAGNFNVVKIYDERTWRYAYEMALSNNMPVVHVYVNTRAHCDDDDFVPREGMIHLFYSDIMPICL